MLSPSISVPKTSSPFTFAIASMYEPLARHDVLDQDGAGGGAVALPQLRAVHTVIGREEQRAVDVRQVVDKRIAASGLMSLTSDGAGGGAVALPQLAPVGVVVGGEEQRAVDVRQPLDGYELALPRVMSLTSVGAGGGAVALPQLYPVRPSLAAKNSVPLTFSEALNVLHEPARV